MHAEEEYKKSKWVYHPPPLPPLLTKTNMSPVSKNGGTKKAVVQNIASHPHPILEVD